MCPAVLALSLTLALLPVNRLAYARAVTVPLFQCDIASAPAQLTVCPVAARQIARTPIPHTFHGPVRTAATRLRAAVPAHERGGLPARDPLRGRGRHLDDALVCGALRQTARTPKGSARATLTPGGERARPAGSARRARPPPG